MVDRWGVGSQRMRYIHLGTLPPKAGTLTVCAADGLIGTTGMFGVCVGCPQRNLTEELNKAERQNQQSKFVEEQLALATVRATPLSPSPSSDSATLALAGCIPGSLGRLAASGGSAG